MTLDVFGEDGGHAGWNETAMVQAIDKVARPSGEIQGNAWPFPPPSPGTYSAYPTPTSITLYKPRQGYPKFDQKTGG